MPPATQGLGAWGNARRGPLFLQPSDVRECDTDHRIAGSAPATSQIKWLSALLVAPAQTIEKVLHRHVERQRKLIQRAGRYAIGGPFAFLQLLERNAERVGKYGLGQARFQPPQAQPRSNVGGLSGTTFGMSGH